MVEAEYTGVAPWFHIWHGNTQYRHYLNNLPDLLGLVGEGLHWRLVGQEITDADAAAIRRAVVWVGSDGRVHVDDWSSRWLRKKTVAQIVRTAIHAHEALPRTPKPIPTERGPLRCEPGQPGPRDY